MSDAYYGVYLIPPPDLVYPLSQAHTILEREFNCRTGGRFMVHCTIKGFTKLKPGASPDDLIRGLDRIFSGTRPFETELYAPWVSNSGTGGESVLLWMRKGEEFQALHDAVWSFMEPHTAPDCLFTRVEPHGPEFPPHVTLVQSDLSSAPGILAQGKALCDYIFQALPGHEFEARDIQLVEFHSDDWDGKWWETLEFRQLKGWTLT